MNNKNLIVVVGPTAIGKTSLSIKLAKHFGCEIISADSRQFYKEMSIGTAAPNHIELEQAKHHFIQHRSVTDDYNVGDFEKDALKTIDELFKNNNYVILIGGSGLYIDAVTKGLNYFPEVDDQVRTDLNIQYKNNGIQVLQKRLKELDPVYFDKVDINNTHRVMRALEVCISSGKPYSSFLNAPLKKRSFNTIKVGISAEREIIYNRINQRVDLMIQEGLLDEVKNLQKHKSLNALNTVGYKEVFRHLDGEWDLGFALSEIKKNTRRFAKRQLTWFKKDQEIKWFDYQDTISLYIDYIQKSSL